MLRFKNPTHTYKKQKNKKRIFSRVFIYGFHKLSLSIYIYIQYIIYAVISMIHKEKKKTKINQQKKNKSIAWPHVIDKKLFLYFYIAPSGEKRYPRFARETLQEKRY